MCVRSDTRFSAHQCLLVIFIHSCGQILPVEEEVVALFALYVEIAKNGHGTVEFLAASQP